MSIGTEARWMAVEMVRKAACDVLPQLSLSDTERKEVETLFSYADKPTAAHYRYLTNLGGKNYPHSHSDYFGLLNASSTLLQHIDHVLVWVDGADGDEAEAQRLRHAHSMLPGPLECSSFLSLKLLHPAAAREKNTLQKILASINAVQATVQQQGTRLADLSSKEKKSVRKKFERLEGLVHDLLSKTSRLKSLADERKTDHDALKTEVAAVLQQISALQEGIIHVEAKISDNNGQLIAGLDKLTKLVEDLQKEVGALPGMIEEVKKEVCGSPATGSEEADLPGDEPPAVIVEPEEDAATVEEVSSVDMEKKINRVLERGFVEAWSAPGELEKFRDALVQEHKEQFDEYKDLDTKNFVKRLIISLVLGLRSEEGRDLRKQLFCVESSELSALMNANRPHPYVVCCGKVDPDVAEIASRKMFVMGFNNYVFKPVRVDDPKRECELDVSALESTLYLCCKIAQDQQGDSPTSERQVEFFSVYRVGNSLKNDVEPRLP